MVSSHNSAEVAEEVAWHLGGSEHHRVLSF
jgi:hypothetical protein